MLRGSWVQRPDERIIPGGVTLEVDGAGRGEQEGDGGGGGGAEGLCERKHRETKEEEVRGRKRVGRELGAPILKLGVQLGLASLNT